jgi:DNA-damage-inducible protein J
MATIQLRINDGIKAEADSLFSSLGLDTSTAIRMFLSAAIENEGIPFDIKHRRPNAELREAMEDARLGRNLYGPFDTVDEMMKSLLED